MARAEPSRELLAARRHDAAVREIAQEFGRPIAEVREIYQGELSGMLSNAAIVEFLPVLAEKRVRARYRIAISREL